jgi:hypothetical protein
MGSDTRETNNVRECGFSNTKSKGSSHMCEANFLVSSITMYNMQFYCETIPDEEVKEKEKIKGKKIKCGYGISFFKKLINHPMIVVFIAPTNTPQKKHLNKILKNKPTKEF